jgi:hypothetical protein
MPNENGSFCGHCLVAHANSNPLSVLRGCRGHKIRMRDHLRREKTGPIPGLLSERTEGSPTYQSGDLGYWRPGGNFVIFYRHDGLTIPSPGIVLLGRVNSGAETFDVPGPVEVTVELIR